MSRHIALLRGINVGRAKRIAMADLRRVVADLGFDDVRTLLNSGNVVFGGGASAARDAGARIERAISKEIGVSSRVTTLSAGELDAIIAADPLSDTPDPSRHFVAFPNAPSDLNKLEIIATKDWGDERLEIGAGAAYLWCPGGAVDSPLAKAVARAMGDAVTLRNWATTLKLQALARS